MTHYIPPQNPNHAQVEQIKAQQEQQKLWAHQQELEAKKRQQELERQIAEDMASRHKQTGQGG